MITLSAWWIPTLASAAVLAWAFLMPMPDSRGSFDLSGFFSSIFRLIVVMFVTMGSWLVYFMWRAA